MKLRALLVLIFFLNIFDAIATAYAVSKEWATELNPFMAFFIERNLLSFFIVKVGMVSASLYLIWCFRNTINTNKYVKLSLNFTAFIYILIMGIHITGLGYRITSQCI